MRFDAAPLPNRISNPHAWPEQDTDRVLGWQTLFNPTLYRLGLGRSDLQLVEKHGGSASLLDYST